MDSRLQQLPALTIAAFVAIGLACGVGYKPAITVDVVANSRHPADLVAYLAQTSADPAVCDVNRTDGPALALPTARLVRVLGEAFAAGEVAPDRWAACSLHLWHSATTSVREALDAELIAQIRAQALDEALADDPRVQARARAVIDVLDGRHSETPLPSDDVAKLVPLITARIAAAGDAEPLLRGLIATLELEGGLHDGKRLDAAAIAAATDEDLLATWALRLPSPDLRDAAGVRLLDLRLARLPVAWREAARAAVIDHGWFAIPADAAVRSAAWVPGPDDTVLLRLLQNPRMGWVRLLPAGRDETRSPDPSVDLRGALKIRVDGLSDPITLCPGADRWDPAPCFPPADLRMTHAIAELAPTGRILFPEQLALDDVLRLGSDGDRLAAQVIVGGAIAPLDLPIVFESVPGYEFGVGHTATYTLPVQVYELSHQRLLIEFDVLGKTRRQLVPESDTQFAIHAKRVEDGSSCNIHVRMRCTNCDEVRAALKPMMISDSGRVDIDRVKD